MGREIWKGGGEKVGDGGFEDGEIAKCWIGNLANWTILVQGSFGSFSFQQFDAKPPQLPRRPLLLPSYVMSLWY